MKRNSFNQQATKDDNDKSQYFIFQDADELEKSLDCTLNSPERKFTKTRRWSISGLEMADVIAGGTKNPNNEHKDEVAETVVAFKTIEGTLGKIENMLKVELPRIKEELVALRQENTAAKPSDLSFWETEQGTELLKCFNRLMNLLETALKEKEGNCATFWRKLFP